MAAPSTHFYYFTTYSYYLAHRAAVIARLKTSCGVQHTLKLLSAECLLSGEVTIQDAFCNCQPNMKKEHKYGLQNVAVYSLPFLTIYPIRLAGRCWILLWSFNGSLVHRSALNGVPVYRRTHTHTDIIHLYGNSVSLGNLTACWCIVGGNSCRHEDNMVILDGDNESRTWGIPACTSSSTRFCMSASWSLSSAKSFTCFRGSCKQPKQTRLITSGIKRF